jgi:uridine kinase
MEKIKVTLLGQATQEYDKGIKLSDLAALFPNPNPRFQTLGATVNNIVHCLQCGLNSDSTVEFLTYKNREGQEIYRRSLSAVLTCAVFELYRNSRMIIGHSLGNAYYYSLNTDVPVGDEIIAEISAKMNEIIQRDMPFEKQTLPKDEAEELFKKLGYPDKVRLIRYMPYNEVTIYRLGHYVDIEYGALVPSTGYVKYFELNKYNTGIILRFPEPINPTQISSIKNWNKLFSVYRESKAWGAILNINNIGRLNEFASQKKIFDIIKIQEALHEKKIAIIADEISKRSDTVKLILIAGPSSSGKTTFSKRLSVQLMVNGLNPIALSLDNYFLNHEQSPVDDDGNLDFECIKALDLELLNSQLIDLLKGKEVLIPEYDFKTGKRKATTKPLRISENTCIIMEGIHGLNEELTSSIPAHNKFKIYASALTQLCIDDYNRIPTTDTRLIRRMVRDAKFRGYSAKDTISRWPSVRRGEERNIFPFQENADIMFNSALIYELSVLKQFAEPLLKEITTEDKEYHEARRLLKFLELFLPIGYEEIPPTSILREFISGSSFKY